VFEGAETLAAGEAACAPNEPGLYVLKGLLGLLAVEVPPPKAVPKSPYGDDVAMIVN
jgi:hypothetical protein